MLKTCVHLQLTSVPMLVLPACTSKMPALSREIKAKQVCQKGDITMVMAEFAFN